MVYHVRNIWEKMYKKCTGAYVSLLPFPPPCMQLSFHGQNDVILRLFRSLWTTYKWWKRVWGIGHERVSDFALFLPRFSSPSSPKVTTPSILLLNEYRVLTPPFYQLTHIEFTLPSSLVSNLIPPTYLASPPYPNPQYSRGLFIDHGGIIPIDLGRSIPSHPSPKALVSILPSSSPQNIEFPSHLIILCPPAS